MMAARDMLRVSTDRHQVDFRRSLPPHIPQLQAHLATALEHISHRHDLGLLMRQSTPRGTEEDRATGRELLRPRFVARLDPSRIIVTNGTQSALLVLLKTLVGSSGVLLVERLSYGALPNLLRLAEVPARGIEIDDDGLIPDAFELACKQWRPKALYCNPTVHNPTTSVMPLDRRLAIAEIARKYDVAILEDDALGRLHPDAPPPMSVLAPDVTWYLMSTTKCLAQGVRIAYLVTPEHPNRPRQLLPFEHMSCWHAAPLCAAVMSEWVRSGAADAMTASIAAECAVRERLARESLAHLDLRSTPGSMHIWLRLPDSLRREDLVAAAEENGVLLRPADVFAVDDQPVPDAVRLSLSSPATAAEVGHGLRTLRNLIGAAL